MSCSESVNKVVEIYVESMKESSADKVREAFNKPSLRFLAIFLIAWGWSPFGSKSETTLKPDIVFNFLIVVYNS